jgi:molybdate transport system permease protein
MIFHSPLPALQGSWNETETRQAIVLSIWTSLAATAVVFVLGLPLAHVLARRSFPGRFILELLIDLPIVLPPAVAGLALLMAFGRRGWLGPSLDVFGLRIPNTSPAVIIAQVFVAGPFFVRTAAVGLSSIPSDLRDAAAIDGASRFQVLRYITLPLAGRGILSGLALCWARALGEFGATIMFAGSLPGITRTMPLAVYYAFETDLDKALAMGTILLGASVVVLLLFRWITRGKS